MESRFQIIIDILTTHYVDSIIINGRIIAIDIWYDCTHYRRFGGCDYIDITDWTNKQIKYDLLNY